jgi:hypothetical protein
MIKSKKGLGVIGGKARRKETTGWTILKWILER